MTVTINASPTNGLVQTADGSGVIKLQSNGVTTNALAWVNFNGASGAIRSSYNVTSVTRSATGNYVVNLTVATSDANYAVLACADYSNTTGDAVSNHNVWAAGHPITTTTASVMATTSASYYDTATMSVAIFGN